MVDGEKHEMYVMDLYEEETELIERIRKAGRSLGKNPGERHIVMDEAAKREEQAELTGRDKIPFKVEIHTKGAKLALKHLDRQGTVKRPTDAANNLLDIIIRLELMHASNGEKK